MCFAQIHTQTRSYVKDNVYTVTGRRHRTAFNITDHQKLAEIMLQERQQSCCVAVKNTLYTINSKRNNLRKYAHYASTRFFKESHVPYCRRDALWKREREAEICVWLRNFTSDTCIFASNKSILHAMFALNTLSNRHRTLHHFIGIERWCLELCVSTSFSIHFFGVASKVQTNFQET